VKGVKNQGYNIIAQKNRTPGTTHTQQKCCKQTGKTSFTKKLFLNVNVKRLMTSDRKLKKPLPQRLGKNVEMGEKMSEITLLLFFCGPCQPLRTQTGFQHSFLELFLK
jgi:hypothetical protein